MQSILLGPLLVACLHCAIASATEAAETDIATRPAPVAATELRKIDRVTARPSIADDAPICRMPAFAHEPLRELIDKYAPSAIEWSLLPHIAAGFSPYHSRRNAVAETPA